MDHMPKTPTPLDAVERAARLKDVTDKARAAKPVDTGKDILRSVIPNEDF